MNELRCVPDLLAAQVVADLVRVALRLIVRQRRHGKGRVDRQIVAARVLQDAVPIRGAPMVPLTASAPEAMAS